MNRIRQPFIRIIVVGISLFVVVSLSQSVWRLWKKQDFVGEREMALVQEKALNAKLKQEFEEAQTPEFVEREAREKLGMTREGETIVILPKSQIPNPNDQEKQKEPLISNWKKWWRLFF